MKNIYKVLMVILLLVIMPVVVGVVVIKLFVGGHGVILAIGFFILVVLGILASVNRLIAYNKSKKQEEGFKKEN
jgi:ABC-type transport system involved in cytochrome bd biosynthesis fused ATPase/permease subunit